MSGRNFNMLKAVEIIIDAILQRSVPTCGVFQIIIRGMAIVFLGIAQMRARGVQTFCGLIFIGCGQTGEALQV